MISGPTRLFAVATALAVSGCAQPLMPTVQVLPPPGKAFVLFQEDQRICSMYTNDQMRPLIDRAATATLGTAALGGLLGLGVGAVVGGGRGAALGAGVGAVGGAAATSDEDRLQRSYDVTYAGCMAARGDQVVQPASPTIVVQSAPAYVAVPTYYTQPQPYYVSPPGTYPLGQYQGQRGYGYQSNGYDPNYSNRTYSRPY